MDDKTWDELLLAVAEAIAMWDGTVDDAGRQYVVKQLLARARGKMRADAHELIQATEEAEC